MKKELALLIFLVAVGCGFASGFWTGRKSQAHHYERFGEGKETNYYIDTATGKVCDPLKSFQDKAYKYAQEHPGPGTSKVFNAADVSIEDPARDYLWYIPACGTE